MKRAMVFMSLDDTSGGVLTPAAGCSGNPPRPAIARPVATAGVAPAASPRSGSGPIGGRRRRGRCPRRDAAGRHGLPVDLETSVGSDISRVEQPVDGRLRRAVTVNGVEVLPAGTVVSGHVTAAQRPGKVKGRGLHRDALHEARHAGRRRRRRSAPRRCRGWRRRRKERTRSRSSRRRRRARSSDVSSAARGRAQGRGDRRRGRHGLRALDARQGRAARQRREPRRSS